MAMTVTNSPRRVCAAVANEGTLFSEGQTETSPGDFLGQHWTNTPLQDPADIVQ